MNGNITIELGSPAFELAPAKPKRFLEKALKRGLTVRFHDTTAAVRGLGWTIESPTNPVDDWQLWLYFQAGSRGGTLTITRYTPSASRRRRTTKITQQMAGITIDDMGDALDRHHARVAQAEAATRQVGEELDGASVDIPTVPTVDPSIAVALTAVPAPKAAVQIVKDTAPLSNDTSLAGDAVAQLKANGRFALRAAVRGTIPRNTPAKVRAALVRRGLAFAAGGTLTDLGRAARALILGS